MPRLRIHTLVSQEMEAARLWYAERSVLAAEAFDIAFFTALIRLEEHPTAHAPWRPPYRRIRLVRFPYLLIYHTGRRHTSVLLLAHERFEPTRTATMMVGRLASLK